MDWIKKLFGIKTWVYSDPFLVNDTHLTARYYQIVRCVETNQIDFVRVKNSPEIGIESQMLPNDSLLYPGEKSEYLRKPVPAPGKITSMEKQITRTGS